MGTKSAVFRMVDIEAGARIKLAMIALTDNSSTCLVPTNFKDIFMPNKCDDCGKFISWNDIENGDAISLIHPDTEFNSEWHESVCKICNKKDK
jgi:hypothetical protein